MSPRPNPTKQEIARALSRILEQKEESMAAKRPDHPVLNQKQWDRKCKAVQLQLFQDYPNSAHQWRFNTSHKVMNREYGPRPPGTIGLIIRALVAYLKAGGEDMKFDWLKNVWKGIRGALLTAVGMAILAFLGALDTEGEALALGFPKWVAPIVVLVVGALIPMVRNFFKIKKGVGRI